MSGGPGEEGGASGVDLVTRPPVAGAEGGFPGKRAGAWCLSSSNSASAYTQSRGKSPAGAGKSASLGLGRTLRYSR